MREQIETVSVPAIGTPVYWFDGDGMTRKAALARVELSATGIIFTDDSGASFTGAQAAIGKDVSFEPPEYVW